MTAGPGQTVLVLGAGLSGLASAYHLRKQGYGVVVLDHPSWDDALCAQPFHAPIDLLGGYKETRTLLRTLDTGRAARNDAALSLEFRLPDGRLSRYRQSRLPAPLHWIVGLLRFEGLSWHDRWNLLSYLERIWERTIAVPSDLEQHTADEWLAAIGQSRQARETIWQPLLQWLTGNPPAQLSAAQCVRSTAGLFLDRSSHSRITRLEGSLEDRLLAPLRTALQNLGVEIIQLSNIPQLRFGETRAAGVQIGNTSLRKADWYLAAMPHRQLTALLPERLLTRFAYFSQIGELTDCPAVSVHVTARSIANPPRLILLSGQPFYRLAVAPQGLQETLYCLSATDAASFSDTTDELIAVAAAKTLRLIAPDVTEDRMHSVVTARRRHATLSLRPGVAALRPIQKSPIQNFAVAGAWTDTGWPADVESALVSARRCVDVITGAD